MTVESIVTYTYMRYTELDKCKTLTEKVKCFERAYGAIVFFTMFANESDSTYVGNWWDCIERENFLSKMYPNSSLNKEE